MDGTHKPEFPQPEGWLDRAALTLATLGPAGRMPKAPGTWGSAAALLLAPWAFQPLPLMPRLAVLAGVLAVGTWAAGRAGRIRGDEDPGCVVVDELLGQWVAFAPFNLAGWTTTCWPECSPPPPTPSSVCSSSPTAYPFPLGKKNRRGPKVTAVVIASGLWASW